MQLSISPPRTSLADAAELALLKQSSHPQVMFWGEIPPIMNYFLRAFGIISLKTLAMSAISVVDLLYVAQYVPVKVHALVMGIVLFLVTFLFAEWILSPTPHISPRRFAVLVLVTYAWDALFGAILWSFLLSDSRILYVQSFPMHLLSLALFAVAFGAAWYDRKRLSNALG